MLLPSYCRLQCHGPMMAPNQPTNQPTNQPLGQPTNQPTSVGNSRMHPTCSRLRL
jgi:hypothetical protein